MRTVKWLTIVSLCLLCIAVSAPSIRVVSAEPEIPAVREEWTPLLVRVGGSTYEHLLCGWENGEYGRPLACGQGAVINGVFVGDLNKQATAWANTSVRSPQKPAEPILIAPEMAQRIRNAYQAEENARLVREAAVSEAKAIAKCWPCTLISLPDGRLAFQPDPTPPPKP